MTITDKQIDDKMQAMFCIPYIAANYAQARQRAIAALEAAEAASPDLCERMD